MSDLVILSSSCGHHFKEDCGSCQSAKASNDFRLREKDDRIEALESALTVARAGLASVLPTGYPHPLLVTIDATLNRSHGV